MYRQPNWYRISPGDYIIIDGGSLGGQSPGVHDLEIRVTDSNTPGEVLNFVFSGTGFDGTAIRTP